MELMFLEVIEWNLTICCIRQRLEDEIQWFVIKVHWK